MAGAACAKAIIDQRNAVNQVTSCLAATILLRATDAVFPTEEHEDAFVEAAQNLAAVAAKIQAEVAGDALGAAAKPHKHPPKG